MPVKETASSRVTVSATAAKASKGKKPDKSSLIEVRKSKIQGRGVFATRPIRKGRRITEYLGERITHDEADTRYDDRNGRHHTFLFILDDETVLDAKSGGSDARYINHSCEANCESVIEDGHIWIEALKSIPEDGELLYDYQFEWQDEYDAEDVRYYTCRCGADTCRGTILKIPRYLKPTVKKWLAGEDVPKPRKPRKKSAKKATRKVARKPVKKSARKTTRKAAKKKGEKATRK